MIRKIYIGANHFDIMQSQIKSSQGKRKAVNLQNASTN